MLKTRQCIYGLPVYPGVLPQLTELRKSLRIQLLVDNEQQLAILEKSNPETPWDIFIKLDVGSHRAGVTPGSPVLYSLVRAAEACPAVRVYGIYCHANHSYGGRTRAEAEDTLRVELDSVIGAAKLLPADRRLIASVGATPTAHVVESLKAQAPANVKLELHAGALIPPHSSRRTASSTVGHNSPPCVAGNYPCNDLQQVSTGLVSETDQAARVAAEVCSVYPERNEALVNAGVTALSRETSAYAGFGVVVDQPGWGMVRMSQEHGILGTTGGRRVEEAFSVGQRVLLYCNHVCITAAAFHAYFVVDAEDVVREAWVPWKGW